MPPRRRRVVMAAASEPALRLGEAESAELFAAGQGPQVAFFLLRRAVPQDRHADQRVLHANEVEPRRRPPRSPSGPAHRRHSRCRRRRTPSAPSCPASRARPCLAKASRGKRGTRSRSAAVGASSRSANWRAMSRICRWPSVSIVARLGAPGGRYWLKLAGRVFSAVARIDPSNSTEYWWDRHLTGLSLLHADFTTHEYPPHTHEALVVAVTEQGGRWSRAAARSRKRRPRRCSSSIPRSPTPAGWDGASAGNTARCT